MFVVFISNYMSHHQRPLCDALYRLTDGNFRFIATKPMGAERKQLGYREEIPEYLCFGGVPEADVVLAGSALEKLLRQHIRAGKLLFRYSERPLKQGLEPMKYLPRLLRWHWRNPPGKPIYLLSASAYAPEDYAKFGLFQNRSYRFGYFPETRKYDLPRLFGEKDAQTILWAGRFVPYKHPDAAIRVARRLREEGLAFKMRLIGTGEWEASLQESIHRYGLEDYVNLLGAMSPDNVRRHMEKAGILLFTSDRQEGWGAVVNEAMNSGCAVVSCRQAGCVPWLIRDEENGLTYPGGDEETLYQAVKRLLTSPAEQQRLGLAAYRTITERWNAELAAKRLLELSEAILRGDPRPDLYSEGPCSTL